MNLFKSKDGIYKSVVCLAPALNVREEKYLDLIDELRRDSNYVVFVDVNNFDINYKYTLEKISNNFFVSYSQAKKIKENNPKAPIYFLGFSFGALIGLYFLNKYFDEIKFDKIVMVAPALSFRLIPNLSRNISSLPFNFSITSFTPKDYRVFNKIPLSVYKIISDLNNEIKNNKFNKLNFPVKIFISSKDEVISHEKIGNIISKYKLTNWNIIKIKNEKENGLRDFYHLIVDKNSLSETDWSIFTNEIKEFLNY
ncbi:MAG: hypothetical protein JXA68_10695 [Ignavibacteriales bacterium]|nr:hypothetical protein [Ignavibacteriales bacterium]